jgi:hypothetical protein
MKKDFGIAIVNSTIDLMSAMVQNTLHYGPELIYVTATVFFRYDSANYTQNCNVALESAAVGAIKVRTYLIGAVLYCVLHTVYSILYTVYCILYTVYCILYTVYCILYTVYCILYTVYCILYTLYMWNTDQLKLHSN